MIGALTAKEMAEAMQPPMFKSFIACRCWKTVLKRQQDLFDENISQRIWFDFAAERAVKNKPIRLVRHGL